MDTPAVSLFLAAVVLFTLGGLERVVSFRHQRQEDQWFASAAKAEGTVIRTVEPHVPSTMTASEVKARFSVVVFHEGNGRRHEFGAAGDAGPVGTRVNVAYEPRDPSTARVVSPSHPGWTFGTGYILMLAGVALGITALVRTPARGRWSGMDGRNRFLPPRPRERFRG